MTRRKTKHRTGLPRIAGIGKKVHDAWVGYICINCKTLNTFPIGDVLIDSSHAYSTAEWECKKCKFLHSKKSPLPFKKWPPEYLNPNSIKCQRFWEGFFRIATENKDAYWKQCNACGRILPSNAFSKHSGLKDGVKERQVAE